MRTLCALCKERTEFLNIVYMSFVRQRVKFLPNIEDIASNDRTINE
jgi:hypothetical protein